MIAHTTAFVTPVVEHWLEREIAQWVTKKEGRNFIYGYMSSGYSDSERRNPLPPHGLLFLISSKGSFISTIPQTGQHIQRPLLHQSWSTGWNKKWLNGPTIKDRSDDPSHHERTWNEAVNILRHHKVSRNRRVLRYEVFRSPSVLNEAINILHHNKALKWCYWSDLVSYIKSYQIGIFIVSNIIITIVYEYEFVLTYIRAHIL